MKKILLSFFIIGLMCGPSYGQQPENAGFEDWEDAGTAIDEPVDWSSIKTSDAGDFVNNAAPVVWGQSTDAHSGNYSLRLENVLTIGSIIATGTITNGRIHADFNPAASYSYTDPDDSRWHMTLSDRPDSLAVWIKYSRMGNDTAQVKALLHVGEGTLPPTPQNQGNWIGYAQINVSESLGEWTRVVVPFNYFSQANPEYMLIILTSGAGLAPIQGSVALYDDVKLIYNPNGLEDLSSKEGLIYTYRMNIHLDKIPENLIRGARLELVNLQGASIWSTIVAGKNVNLEGSGITEGIYVIKISSKDGVYTQKVHLR